MSEIYDPCYLDVFRGLVCPIFDQELIALFCGERVIKDAKNTAKRLSRFEQAVGDPDEWEITDGNRDVLVPVRKSMTYLHRILSNAGHLQLPSAEHSS